MTDTPLIIDSFAGGGGASTGIEMALGVSPDYAINHNADALALHEANHPETIHLNSNIWEVDPAEVAKGRRVGLLWASPDCKHFSKAKGGAPKDRNIRDLAWVIVKWAEEVKPDVILMENVEEFRTWGPVGEDGRTIKEFEGMTFDLWAKRLRAAGYKLAWKELRGCDFGAPTIRKRFFMVARRDGRPIAWPKPTHVSPDMKYSQRPAFRTAAENIDWSIPCPSIFMSKAEAKEYGEQNSCRPPKRPLAGATLARIARGMQRYVIEAERPFVVNLTHGGRLEDLAEPIRTITGANRSEKAVVVPSITRFNGGATGQDMRKPLATITANSWIKRPGGAAPLGMILPHLVSVAHGDSGGRREYPVNEPLGTTTAGGVSRSVITPSLVSLKGSTRRDFAADAPHPTILAGGGHSSVIAPLLVQTGYGERKGQLPRALDPFTPLGTAVAGGIKHAPVAAFLAQHNKARQGVNPGRPIDTPISTLTTTGSQQSVISPFIARQFGQSVGHKASAPLATTTAGGGGKSGLIAPWFAKYYGTGDGARTDEPLHTITVKDRMGHMQAHLQAPEFTPDMEYAAYRVARFLEENGAWDGRRFVTLEIDGAEFVVVDIGMRMLTPRELFNCQGFPPDYVIEGVWERDGDDWSFREFTKTTQVSCVGNSVCPQVAAALIRANCQHLIEEMRKAA